MLWCAAHRAQHDDDEEQAADDGEQSAQAHQPHAGDFGGACAAPARRRPPCAARRSRPTRPGRRCAATGRAPYSHGCTHGEPALRRRVAQARQDVEDQAHQGQRHADDAAVVVRGDLDVGAADGQADQAAGGEQQHRRQQRGAQRALCRRQRARRGHRHQHGQGRRQDRHAAAEAHGPGVQVAVLDGGDVVREVGHRRDEDAGQREREQQQHDPRRQRDARAAGLRQRQPADQHQQRPDELQRVAAAPEQQFVVRLVRQVARRHRERPAEGEQRHRGGDRAGVEAEAQRALAGGLHADARRGGHRVQHEDQRAGAEDDEAGAEQRAVEQRDVVGHHRRTGAGDEGRRGHHRGAQAAQGQRERRPEGAGRRAAVQRPQHRGDRDEPDQHRQVHVHDERGAEEVARRQEGVDARRAREHEQHREQARADQRRECEPEPGARQAAVAGGGQGVVRGVRRRDAGERGGGGGVHCSVMPPFSASKSMTSTWPGTSCTWASRWYGLSRARTSSDRRTDRRRSPAGTTRRS